MGCLPKGPCTSSVYAWALSPYVGGTLRFMCFYAWALSPYVGATLRFDVFFSVRGPLGSGFSFICFRVFGVCHVGLGF